MIFMKKSKEAEEGRGRQEEMEKEEEEEEEEEERIILRRNIKGKEGSRRKDPM